MSAPSCHCWWLLPFSVVIVLLKSFRSIHVWTYIWRGSLRSLVAHSRATLIIIHLSLGSWTTSTSTPQKCTDGGLKLSKNCRQWSRAGRIYHRTNHNPTSRCVGIDHYRNSTTHPFLNAEAMKNCRVLKIVNHLALKRCENKTTLHSSFSWSHWANRQLGFVDTVMDCSVSFNGQPFASRESAPTSTKWLIAMTIDFVTI
jgi:hypothetical protein